MALFLLKNRFLAQISTDLDKILDTPIVVRNTIHLWADLDRDRRVGGSRPNQNDYVFFCILATPRRIAAISAANRQSGGEDGCYREKFRNFFVARAEPDPKTAFFRVFRIPFDYPAHSLQETVLPQTNGTDGKPISEGVP